METRASKPLAHVHSSLTRAATGTSSRTSNTTWTNSRCQRPSCPRRPASRTKTCAVATTTTDRYTDPKTTKEAKIMLREPTVEKLHALRLRVLAATWLEQ